MTRAFETAECKEVGNSIFLCRITKSTRTEWKVVVELKVTGRGVHGPRGLVIQ